MASVTAGLAGGFVATLVMTVFMMVGGDDGPPPTALLIEKFGGGSAEDYKMPGMVLHLLYGTVMGAVFVLLAPEVGADLSSLLMGAVWGVLFGIVVMFVGMVFWMRVVIGMEPDKQMMAMFGGLHLLYGIVLGLFVAAGIV